MHKQIWRRTALKLIPYTLVMAVGIALSNIADHGRSGSLDSRFLAIAGVLLFITAATVILRLLTGVLHGFISLHHLGPGRAGSIQFVLRAVGYVAIGLITLDLVGIPVGRLLLGGAVLGIILGVAAQQALANFFASIVLVISRPFSVGQAIVINSGALGGRYAGTILDIGLTHTQILDEEGNRVLLPNAALLSGATIMAVKATPHRD